MNSEHPGDPCEELELRVTALLLGELSADEAAAVREAVAKDPELTRLHDDLQQTIHLVRQATTNAGELVTEQASQPTLSEARRKELLTHFAIPPLKSDDRKPKPLFQLGLIEWAAVLAIIAAMAAISFPATRAFRAGLTQTDVLASGRPAEESLSRAWGLKTEPTMDSVSPLAQPRGPSNVHSLNVVGYIDLPTDLRSATPGAAAAGWPALQPSTSGELPMARGSLEQAGTPLATPPPEASVAALAPPTPVLPARQSQITLPSLAGADGDGKAKDETLRESGSTPLFVGDPEFIGLLSKNGRNATTTTEVPVSQNEFVSRNASIATNNTFSFRLPTDEKSKSLEGLGEVAVTEGSQGGGSTGGLRFFTSTNSFDAAFAISTPLPIGENVALDSFSVVPNTPAIDPSTGLPIKVESGLDRADGGVFTRRFGLPGVVVLTDSPVTNSGFLALDETRRLAEVDRDKAPVLGNLPDVGALFRSEQNRPHGTTVVGLNYYTNTSYRQPAQLGVEEFGRASTNVVLYAESPAANTSLADLIRGPSVRPQSTIVSNGQTWEFAGYDDPGQFIPQGQSASIGADGTSFSIQAQLPVARYRLKQASPSAVPESSGHVGERTGVTSQTAPVTPLKPVQQQLDRATAEKLAGSLGEGKPVENFGAIVLPTMPGESRESAEVEKSRLAAVPSRLLGRPAGERAGERETLEKKIASVQQESKGQRNKLDSSSDFRAGLKQTDVLESGRLHQLKLSDADPAGIPPTKEEDHSVRAASTNAPVPQPEIQTSENIFSTFSLNVSDVSFKLAAASLEKGQMPDAASVRSEEFINAFDYRDPEPAAGAPIAFTWERVRYPFAHNRDLLRFSLKTAAAGRQAGRPLNIVLLLDNSGSMERADRVSIIREALRVLASQLQPRDKLSVITFSRTAWLIADGISGDKAGELAEQVSGLTPQGGTNLEDAMNLAYQTAARHYLANGINRVVLLTDGAANLGNVEPESLKQKVEAQRKQGIALDCFGIGWEGLNDDLLEVLSRNGDGRYGFINSPEEAATDFAGQLAGALKVAASDVKVQVEFNPKRVTAYRQIGYAKHQLTKEQFRDNTVDAAEIAAQEAGNALYTVEVNPAGEGPLGTVRVRFKIPGTTDYREQAWDVPYAGNAASLEQSSPAMRLAATASAFSEWLVASPFAGEVTPDRLLGYLSGVSEVYGADSRPKKLEWMIRQAKSIAGKQ